MFVRFREIKHQDGSSRLEAALIEARRRDGKPRQEFVAALGSIRWPEPSFDARLAFWETLHQRLSRLANRIGDAEKIIGAVNARIAEPTEEEFDEQRQGNAEDEIAEAERRAADWASGEESNTRIIKGLEVAVEQARNTLAAMQAVRTHGQEQAAFWRGEAERLKAGGAPAGWAMRKARSEGEHELKMAHLQVFAAISGRGRKSRDEEEP